MSARAEQLANRFQATNDAVIAAIDDLTEAQWRADCPSDDCNVAALTLHVAGAYSTHVRWTRALVEDGALPEIMPAQIDQGNALYAARNAGKSQTEALEKLRANGRLAADCARNLSDAQLDRVATFPMFAGATMSLEQFIANVMIGHPREHLATIQHVTGG